MTRNLGSATERAEERSGRERSARPAPVGFFGGSGTVVPKEASAQGRVLRRFLWEPDQWKILRNGELGGWLDGACAILADALCEVLGPSAERIMLTDARGVPQHIAVVYRGMIIDGDGVSTQGMFLHRWRTVEHVRDAAIALFDQRRLDSIPRNKGASTELAAKLWHFFGLGDPPPDCDSDTNVSPQD